jgi:UDP-N-acetylglucosamine pyrophosphorylase
MRTEPGFIKSLRDDLERVPQHVRNYVNRSGGLSETQLIAKLSQPTDDTVLNPEPIINENIVDYVNLPFDDCTAGINSINNGEVAYCILGGGSGTRLGGQKSRAIVPGTNRTLLQHKLDGMFIDGVSREFPTWVMTNHDDHIIRQHVVELGLFTVKCFDQFETYRLTPDNRLIFGSDGLPEMCPTGHGDVIPALQQSGMLDVFRAQGGKYVVVSNVDNALGVIDPMILGAHIRKQSKLTCEIVKREKHDVGGIPCLVDNMVQIVEPFQLADDFNIELAPWHNVNTMIINVDNAFDRVQWKWYRIRKQLGSRIVLHHERPLGEMTACFETMYVNVPREERYLPVKTPADMEIASEILST